MAQRKTALKQPENVPLVHGAADLPSVNVDNYNIEVKDKDGFIGDKASKGAFQRKIEGWRKAIRQGGEDPLGDVPIKDLSKKKIDGILKGDDRMAQALILAAIEDFASELANVLMRYMREDAWKKVERVVVGGGLKETLAGEMAIARANLILHAEGHKVTLTPIAHHPDDAGLIGSVHLMPSWMLKGHGAILAVDIGGTNIRAGVVELNQKDKPDFSDARVWKSDIWRHADDSPARSAAIERLVDMLKSLIGKASKANLSLAPVIGIACPGLINADGSIERGGQNLPGGNWESEHFNLPVALAKALPTIGDGDTFVIMHNDAVVQGLSQVPFMRDAKRWGVLTIGTGLGNAHFTNKDETAKG